MMNNKYEEKYIFNQNDIIKYQKEEAIFISDDIDFEIDLSIFTKVKELRIQCNKFRNIGSLKNLEYLNIMPLKTKYLEEVSILYNLTRLDITKGDIANLDFIKGLNKLEKLELYYLRKLSCISGLEKVSNSIKDLSFVSCKNIKSLVPLKKLVNLKRLELTKVRIEDLEFLKGINKLEKLLILETSIDSVDLSPATNIPWISIDNKKHYNYICDHKKDILIPKNVKKQKRNQTALTYPISKK